MLTVLRILAFSLLWLGISLPVLADDTMLPSVVVVDAFGTDATAAKNEALAKAQTEALEQILRKFSPELAPEILAKLPPEKLDTLVRGIEVLDEKISGNRYRATLKVNLSGDGIEKLLADASRPPPPAMAGGMGGVLIFPLYDNQGTLTLWEPKNPWWSVLSRAALELGKGQVIVPFGDSADTALLSPENIMGAGYDAMVPFLHRYGSGDAVVLSASISGEARMVLTVHQRMIGKEGDEIGTFTFHADEAESKNDLLARVARDLVTQLAARRLSDQQAAAFNNTPGNRQMMVASISTLAAWSKIRTALNSLPMVKRVDIIAMAPRQVDVVVHYRGEAEVLADAMKVKGLRVVKADNYWVIAKD